MKILVTGVSGYVGSLLAPALLAGGHTVRGLARTPSRVHLPPAITIVKADLSSGTGLAAALDGIEVAYYLVHSMEGTTNFSTQELLAAERFAGAAEAAGVRRIIYMSVLTPADEADYSEHVKSRLAVEAALAARGAEVIVLRASIVIGAKSRSFAFLLRIVQRFPVMVLPPWRKNRTAPIDERDLLRLLVAAATASVDRPLSVYDAVGPDVLTYGELTKLISNELLVSRPAVPIPVSLSALTAPIAAAVSGEDLGLVQPLMASLGEDLLPRDPDPHEIELPRPHHSMESAVGRALRMSELDTGDD